MDIYNTWNRTSGSPRDLLTISGTSMVSSSGPVVLMQDAAFTIGGKYMRTSVML